MTTLSDLRKEYTRMEHTPGPWKVSSTRLECPTHDDCPPVPFIILPGAGALIAELSCGWPKRETEANARLIAAAPQLYEALKEAADALWKQAAHRGGDSLAQKGFQAADAARAALALVEGTQE